MDPRAAGARGTDPGRPQRSREAAPDRGCWLGRRARPASSTSGRALQRCSVPAPALAIGRSGSAAGGTSALQRTCGSRTDRMGTALSAAWPLVRARCRMCVHSDSGPDAPPPRASLSRPGAPQERSPLIPDVCQYRTCVIWPFPADLDDFHGIVPQRARVPQCGQKLSSGAGRRAGQKTRKRPKRT